MVDALKCEGPGQSRGLVAQHKRDVEQGVREVGLGRDAVDRELSLAGGPPQGWALGFAVCLAAV